MIKICFFRNRKTLGLQIKGHAGYNPGNDIVCAGISAIACSLAGYLCQKAEKKLLTLRVESGDAEIQAKRNRQTAGAFRMAETGFLQIEEQYGGYIQVTGAIGRGGEYNKNCDRESLLTRGKHPRKRRI